jgi:hypothetical protein
MPKVDDVAWMSQRHGFLVRQDNDQLIASFEFTSLDFHGEDSH